MKRKPTSKIYYTAMYLHYVRGMTTFTARQIADNQWDAQAWLHAQIPRGVLRERAAIFKKHDFPASHPYFDVDDLSTYPHIYRFESGYDFNHPIHDDMRKLFKGYPHIHEIYYSRDMATAEVSNACNRHGYFELVATKPYRTYRIAPMYVNHPTFTTWRADHD